MLAATETFPRSASLAFIWAVTAQPPFWLKSAKRISFTQTIPHLSNPSSSESNTLSSLSGFRTPTITITTLAKLGFPFTASRALYSESIPVYSSKRGKPDGRSILRFCNLRNSMSMLFCAGQIKSSSPVFQGVTFIGISYS